MKDFDIYAWVALVIVLIGGINWAFVGLFNLNLISAIFGATLGRIIFIIVGIAALYLCYLLFYASKKASP